MRIRVSTGQRGLLGWVMADTQDCHTRRGVQVCHQAQAFAELRLLLISFPVGLNDVFDVVFGDLDLIIVLRKGGVVCVTCRFIFIPGFVSSMEQWWKGMGGGLTGFKDRRAYPRRCPQ